MSGKTIYYLAGEAPSALVRKFAADLKTAKMAYSDFLLSIGAERAYMGCSFDFKSGSHPPAGLKRYARSKSYQGDWYADRSPEGRALKARFDELPDVPQRFDLTAALAGGFGKMAFQQGRYGFAIFDDAVVIISAEGWAVPVDCTPIKASTYHLMVEAREAPEVAR